MVSKGEENNLWSEVLLLSGLGAWEFKKEDASIYLSEPGKEILGLTMPEPVSISRFCQLFTHPLNESLKHSLILFTAQNLPFILRQTLLNGRWIRIKGFMVEDGEKRRYLGTLEVLEVWETVMDFTLASQHEYHYLFEDNPMPMFIWEFSTLNIVDCNRQALMKYGYTREEFLKLNIRDIRPEEDIPLIEKYTSGEDAYGEFHKKIWRHKTKGGDIMHVEITGHLVEIDGKRCSMVLIHDISERIEAEEQLLESLKELSDYRFALDESCLVVIVNAEKKVEYVNQKFQETSGFDTAGINGSSLQILYPEEDDSLIRECWEEIRSGKVWRGELRGTKREGGYFWANTVVVPIRDNKRAVYRYIWVGYDITSKKSLDLALVEERSILRAIIDNLPIQIYVKDLQGRHIINNKFQYENFLGATTEQETLGKTVMDYFSKDKAADMMAYDQMIIQTGKSVLNLEEHYFDEEGEKIWLLTNKVPLFDSQGQVMGLVGMSKDVTKRKKEEEKLKNLYKELELKAKELEISNQELEQFAYVASHDLQEPLRMITGFLGLLEKKYDSILDDKGRQYIHFAVDGAMRMKSIIIDLLAYSRVGRKEEKAKFINVGEIVENIIKLNKALIHQKHARFKVHPFPRLYIPISPLHQVFQNLISNSLKYQSTENTPQIEIGCKERRKDWCFYVKDNGIGISTVYSEKVFVLFSRLHSKNEYSGTGIGLAMCKKIIENLGGKIWFRSSEGRGSTFYFTVPKIAPKDPPRIQGV